MHVLSFESSHLLLMLGKIVLSPFPTGIDGKMTALGLMLTI
jgi:hypothetical protein